MSDERYLPTTPEGRLFRLVEECGEVIQAVGKIGRFGPGGRHPDGGPTNAETLAAEIGDLQEAMNDVVPDMLAELRRQRDGGGNPTIGKHCVVWGCGKAALELRGEFWCCPVCGGSYGKEPFGPPVDQDAVP